MLATMVLLGMNRIVVRTASAPKSASRDRCDKARVDFAQSAIKPPFLSSWNRSAFNQASMMVSTVGANVQADAEPKAELFGR